MRLLGNILLLTIAFQVHANDAVIGFTKVDQKDFRKTYQVANWTPEPDALRQNRVVVIGTSFFGFVEGTGQLPDSARLYPTLQLMPEAFQNTLTVEETAEWRISDEDVPSTHDLDVAKLHWETTGKFAEGPEYALVVARNPKELNLAARFATWWGARLVICAQNFPGFGNRDGFGKYYKEIDRYLSDPRNFWVNSAGNYNKATHTASAKTNRLGHFIFANGENYLRLKMRVDGTIRITAAWDSFERNTKDLLLRVINEDGRTIYTYEKWGQLPGDTKIKKNTYQAIADNIQVDRADGRKKNAEFSVENLSVPLRKNSEDGYYYIQLVDQSGNFVPKDEIRIIVKEEQLAAYGVEDAKRKAVAPAMELIDWNPGKNIYYPAEHAEIIAAGEISSNSSRGANAMGMVKGEVYLQQTDIRFSDGRTMSGTSPITGVHGGQITLLQTRYADMTRKEYHRYRLTLPVPPLDSRDGQVENISRDWNKFVREKLPLIQKQYPRLLETLDIQTGTKVNSFGLNSTNGMLVLGYQQSPSDFTNVYDGIPANVADDYEYYVAFWTEQDSAGNSANRMLPMVRKRRTDSNGEEEAMPWLRDGAPTKNPGSYIELRRLRHADERKAETNAAYEQVGREWKMPTIAEADRYFGR